MTAPSEFTVACAWAELLRLEAAHAPREMVNSQRRHAKKVTRDWRLSRMSAEQAAQGRIVGEGSVTTAYVDTAAC